MRQTIQWLLRQNSVLYVVIFLSVLISYSGMLHNEFIGYDDDKYVTENVHAQQGISKDSILWAFSSLHASNWHPVTWLSHMLDVELYGMNSRGHHCTSLLLHMANSLLLFLVLKSMTGKAGQSCAVALLFAVHPLHVESVAWVAERKDVFSAFFWMLTMWSYLLHVRTQRRDCWMLTMLFFLLALMAKPMAVTLPFALLLLDYWPLQRIHIIPQSANDGTMRSSGAAWLQLIYEKTPLFLLSAASCGITFFAQHHGNAVGGLDEYPLRMRAANALLSYVSYLQKTIFPHDLGILYPYPATIHAGQIAGAGIVLAGTTYAAARYRERLPWLLVGWLWYLGTLVPVIGIVQVGVQAYADRYTYLPLVGIFIIASWGIAELFRAWPRSRMVLSVSAAAVFSLLIIATKTQTACWSNSITLFEHTLKVTDGNSIIHNNLGFEFALQGQSKKALEQYREALRINPTFEQAIVNYGSALFASGQIDESFAHYQNALKSNPHRAPIHYSFGALLLRAGRNEAAAGHFQEALRIDPEFAGAWNGLGAVMLRQGKLAEATMLFKKALQANPDCADARVNLLNVSHYSQTGAAQNTEKRND